MCVPARVRVCVCGGVFVSRARGCISQKHKRELMNSLSEEHRIPPGMAAKNLNSFWFFWHWLRSFFLHFITSVAFIAYFIIIHFKPYAFSL